MTWFLSHWLHLLLLLAYLAVIAHHAWVGKRGVRSLEDYLVAGRGMGGFVIGLSFYATFMSTNTFIGAAGKSWDVGLAWCLGGFILVALCCLSWFVVAPRFVPLTRRYESLTVADFLGSHYNSPAVRSVAAVIVCFASVVYLVAIYRGAALALGSFLDLPYVQSLLFVFVVVTSYTLAGGFKSIVLTDSLQGVLMVVGAVSMLVAVIAGAGGLGPLLDNLRRQDPHLVSWQGHMPYIEIAALSLAVGIKYLVEPRQLSRFYGLKDRSALRVASIVSPLLVIVTYAALLPIGALAHAFISPGEIDSTDEVIPYLLSTVNVLGPLVGTFFLLVLLSAAMSSIDSVLLVAASTIEHDLISRGTGSTQAVTRTRALVVIVSTTTLLVALTPFTDDIVTLTAFSGSLYGACFFPTLVIGLYLRRTTARAALAALVLGSIAVITWFVARKIGATEIHEVYVGLAVGVTSYLVCSLCWPESNGSPSQNKTAPDPQPISGIRGV